MELTIFKFTVAVEEFSPYVPINGVKWGKFNLQYTPGAKADGWDGGYHLTKNPSGLLLYCTL